MESMSDSGPEVLSRASVFCLLPADLSDELLEPLREHFAGDPSVDVIVDRRIGQRRSGVDRRALLVAPPELVQRRSGVERRERHDRRAPSVPRRLTLPPEAEPHGARIRFLQRLPAVASHGVAALPLPDLVRRIQAGDDPEAATEFYWRLFERVYSRVRALQGRYSRPDEHMAGLFGVLLDRVGEWQPGGAVPFEDWLYAVVDEHAATLPRERDR